MFTPLYQLLSLICPTDPPPRRPRRVVLILPCCIGDVVLATATLKALRQGYPGAHITWMVGTWSRGVIEGHDLLDAIIDTGDAAIPVRSPGDMWRFVALLRDRRFDLAVSLVRSPLMSLALLLSGINFRAGLDSDGRGFGYNIRASIDPNQPRHEAEIYLDVARALGLQTQGCKANVPLRDADRKRVKAVLNEAGIRPDYIVINPAGGRNPGMVMDSKRWPQENFAALGDSLAERSGAAVVLVGGPDDADLLAAVRNQMSTAGVNFAGTFSFGEIAALAAGARVYIGNDTGLTHLAAAAGARTVMILGPSDPARYAPFVRNTLTLWKPTVVRRGGVAKGTPATWDWARDGISAGEVEARVAKFMGL